MDVAFNHLSTFENKQTKVPNWGIKIKKLGDKHKFTRSTATSATQWYAPINSGRIRIYGNWNKNIKLINIPLATQERTMLFIMDFIFRACLRQRESGVRSEIKSLVTKIDLVMKIDGLWSGLDHVRLFYGSDIRELLIHCQHRVTR